MSYYKQMDEMDDSEVWSKIRAEKARKRQENQHKSTKLLKEHGFNFQSRNDGIHLILTHHNHVFDFWPSTGKWRERGTEVYNRGVFKLMRHLRKLEQHRQEGIL